ncbi:MAG TPA: hypothetical protein DEV98_00880 [Clostridiales bacterium]|nr:hypothetical protein [Clostridiales bacterium]
MQIAALSLSVRRRSFSGLSEKILSQAFQVCAFRAPPLASHGAAVLFLQLFFQFSFLGTSENSPPLRQQPPDTL